MTNNFFGFDSKIIELADKAENLCDFSVTDKIKEYNTAKVLSAFINNRVSEQCFYGSSGYGYGDMGRETLDKVYAQAFGTEDALVRHNFVSGTHALSTALWGVLRSGDTMVSVTGAPYDTLEEVIGIAGTKGSGSLIDYGVKYKQIDLMSDGKPDLDKIALEISDAKVAYIQRSRGYSLRPALSIDDIKDICRMVKNVNPNAVIMVDNCYGEFVDVKEPTEVGADLIVGSLIKNPGGGIARTGGYIAGNKDLVELCSYRLTCVGMGKEVGCTLSQNREMFLGFFMSPEIVANAVKTADFAASIFSLLGFESFPSKSEKRSDIITAVKLGNPELLKAFCRGIQKGSPVDSFVTPEAWDMPGYESQVIMAAGAFTMGASIELSADAPIRDPYAVWMQGGITYSSGKTGVMLAVQEMVNDGLIKI
ncbi:MAG: aminotransferase class I/II-fold pyridoxal phosphate-dependent enzyme [Oscillospiraceae bacterium]|jgi:cystathionine beta-lyase family protein involved in aluminum resistance|nr:methionine gamma-lyase family protein [Ruminococcus sp.]